MTTSATQMNTILIENCRFTQNERLSKRRQNCCQNDNFLVVTEKVVKVISICNQNVVLMTTQIWYQLLIEQL